MSRVEDINIEFNTACVEDTEESIPYTHDEMKEIFEDTNKPVSFAGKEDQKGKRFKAFGGDEIKPIHTEIINKGYIPLVKNAPNMFTGSGGSGKSAIAIKSAIVYLLDNPKKKAFLWMSEDYISSIESRTRTICGLMNVEFDPIWSRMRWQTKETDDNVKLVTKEGGTAKVNGEYLSEVAEYCVNNRVGIVVFDPLKRFHTVDENSNSEMDIVARDVFATFPTVAGVTVIVIHHTAKGKGGGRGAIAITDAMRLAWSISVPQILDAETNTHVRNPKLKGKVQLNLFKENEQVEKYCTIRDEKNLISNPLVAIDDYREIHDLGNGETEVVYDGGLELPTL